MKLEIHIDGKTFTSPSKAPQTPNAAAESLYNVIEHTSKMQLPLTGGDILVLGPEAVKRAVFVIKP